MRTTIAFLALAALGLTSCKVQATNSGSAGTAPEEAYRKLKDSREAKLYTLTNKNGMIARITEYGAILVGLEVPDKDGKVAGVTHGYDILDGWLTNTSYFPSCILKPGETYSHTMIHKFSW